MDVSSSSQFGELKPTSGADIRRAFLAFFAERGHKVIPSASLIPEDPTVLLTIAGMLPFKPIFLGQRQPPAARATSSQKCIRTNDIENVGRTARHHTFFEMLGNFSFGDYFKKEAIQWAWELSTEVFGLDKKNLVVSIFREDEEANTIWKDLIGIHQDKIIRMDEADNFWSSGPTGPCGPCSELYYDFKPELGTQNINLEDDSRFIEFYNLVFMQYNKDASGKLTKLENFNIDTGMGLERMAQILQKVPNNYETDLIFPLILQTAKLANLDYFSLDENRKISLKVIADHARAVTQLISDGVSASNIGRGYILRRLLRRMIRHGRLLGINKKFVKSLGSSVISLMIDAYPELEENKKYILSELENEEIRFLETLDRGVKLLQDIIHKQPQQISGADAFLLYDTYGFPLELTQEIAAEKNLTVDLNGFNIEMKKQRERAKSAQVTIDLTSQNSIQQIATDLNSTVFKGYETLKYSSTVLAILVNGKIVNEAISGDKVNVILDQTPFFGESGGQVGDNGFLVNNELIVCIDSVKREKEVFVHAGIVQRGKLIVHGTVEAKVDQTLRRRAQANHTATHLLQSALKKIVDTSIGQRGSLVAFDRLRFDFNSPRPLTGDELQNVEDMINCWIAEDHPLVVKSMPIDEALSLGALAMFGEKYGDVVRVVDVPGVSMELCGGTHVKKTAELGAFKIISETGVASGIRRIEAIAGQSILDYLNERDVVVKALSELFKAQPKEIIDRVNSLQNELKGVEKDYKLVSEELASLKVLDLANHAISTEKMQFVVQRIDGITGKALQTAAQKLMKNLGENSAIVLGGLPDLNDPTKVVLVVAFGKEVIAGGLNAGKFISPIAKLCGGGGGGRAHLAQAGGGDANALNGALETARENLLNALNDY